MAGLVADNFWRLGAGLFGAGALAHRDFDDEFRTSLLVAQSRAFPEREVSVRLKVRSLKTVNLRGGSGTGVPPVSFDSHGRDARATRSAGYFFPGCGNGNVSPDCF